MESSGIKKLLDVTLSARSRLKSLLPPADYLDKLYEEMKAELSSFLPALELLLLEKIYLLIEHDYRKVGLVGKGYHCLEHSLELAILILKSFRRPNSMLPKLNASELLEMTVAALLHDYDPHRKAGVPVVERTIHAVKSDFFLQDFLERLHLQLDDLLLLVERTDYPFSSEKKALWEAKLLFRFPEEKARMHFRDRAEKLALFDKAATYFSLSPEETDRRVRGLEEEVELPFGTLLSLTYDFLRGENVGLVAEWVPDEYKKRWEMVERHYFNLRLRDEIRRGR